MDEASHSLDRLAAASERLLATATALSDAQAREPSLLPGWTRGHVLTHIARNADGMVNLLSWARTGTETPMYASAESRNADIEAGAGRRAADLAADLRESAARFAAAAAVMPGDAWAARVRALRGPGFPALGVLDRRLSEVEIHRIGPAGTADPPVVVHGQPAELLAWLLGRDGGAGLRVSGQADGAPALPPWR